jgi:hypothetical protein
MKIHIWVSKIEAVTGNITKYYDRNPQPTVVQGGDYVQVEISQDKFAQLMDPES